MNNRPSPASAMQDVRDWLSDFLTSQDAQCEGHSGRTLLVHLLGTFDLLQAWECDREVCLAGGLHSVYGTNAFTRNLLAVENDWLGDLVGPRTSRLVWLFHSINRPTAIVQAFGQGGLRSRFSGDLIPASHAEMVDLLAIECANLSEQGSGQSLLRGLRALEPQAAHSILPPGVVRGLSLEMTKPS